MKKQQHQQLKQQQQETTVHKKRKPNGSDLFSIQNLTSSSSSISSLPNNSSDQSPTSFIDSKTNISSLLAPLAQQKQQQQQQQQQKNLVNYMLNNYLNQTGTNNAQSANNSNTLTNNNNLYKDVLDLSLPNRSRSVNAQQHISQQQPNLDVYSLMLKSLNNKNMNNNASNILNLPDLNKQALQALLERKFENEQSVDMNLVNTLLMTQQQQQTEIRKGKNTADNANSLPPGNSSSPSADSNSKLNINNQLNVDWLANNGSKNSLNDNEKMKKILAAQFMNKNGNLNIELQTQLLQLAKQQQQQHQSNQYNLINSLLNNSCSSQNANQLNPNMLALLNQQQLVGAIAANPFMSFMNSGNMNQLLSHQMKQHQQQLIGQTNNTTTNMTQMAHYLKTQQQQHLLQQTLLNNGLGGSAGLIMNAGDGMEQPFNLKLPTLSNAAAL